MDVNGVVLQKKSYCKMCFCFANKTYCAELEGAFKKYCPTFVFLHPEKLSE